MGDGGHGADAADKEADATARITQWKPHSTLRLLRLADGPSSEGWSSFTLDDSVLVNAAEARNLDGAFLPPLRIGGDHRVVLFDAEEKLGLIDDDKVEGVQQ